MDGVAGGGGWGGGSVGWGGGVGGDGLGEGGGGGVTGRVRERSWDGNGVGEQDGVYIRLLSCYAGTGRDGRDTTAARGNGMHPLNNPHLQSQ